MIYANCGAIAVITSTTYMTIVELFDEYSTPFFPEVIKHVYMFHWEQRRRGPFGIKYSSGLLLVNTLVRILQ